MKTILEWLPDFRPLAIAVTSAGLSFADIEAVLRVLVLLFGLAGTILAGYWNFRAKRIQIRNLQGDLCKQCRRVPVTHCPVPVSERPANCPYNP